MIIFLKNPFLRAQTVSQYAFSQTTSTYTPIIGTSIITGVRDNGLSSLTNIGFNFVYHGVTFTKFYASSNGFIVLGNTVLSLNGLYTPVSSEANCISFFGINGKTLEGVNYVVSGSAPNRVLTVEYPNWAVHYQYTLNKINAQIKLYETTNIIEIVYGSSSIIRSFVGEVGLSGASSSDFSNRNTTTDWTASTDGLYNTATCLIDSNVVPPSGLTFRWTPPVECSGTPNSGLALISDNVGCADISFLLSVTGLSNGLGITYQWQTSSDGISNWSDISGGTNPILNTATSATAFYRMKSICVNSGLENYSNVVSYTVENCIPASGSNTYTTCGSTLFDIGGSVKDYAYAINGTTVLKPDVLGSFVEVDGLYFTEPGFDYLYVYDGSGTDGTLLGQFSGNGHIPTLTSMDPSGSLTVVFYADGTNQYSGFNINVNCVDPCVGTPIPGNTISSIMAPCAGQNFELSLPNQIIYSGVSYQWQYSDDGIFYSDIDGATFDVFTTNQTSAEYYRCLVTSIFSGLSEYSNELFVPMTTTNCYCQPESILVTADDAIKKVVLTNSNLTSFTNLSSSNGITNYDNYLNTPFDLQQGSTSNSLAISFSPNGIQWSAAWIDFDQNGVFDPSENIALATHSSGGSTTANYVFSVPVTATLGNTKMRVRGGSNTAYTDSDACSVTNYGETEDYNVNIVPVYVLSIDGPASSCSSTDIQYTIATNNFPETPTYQWFYNGIPLSSSGGLNAPYYTTYFGGQSEILNVNTYGDTYSPVNWSCVATYNGWTATSNIVSLSVLNGSPSSAPTSISITNNSTCSATSKTLTLVGGSLGTGATWKWYSGSCGGTSIGVGASITVSPTENTTYYVRADGACNNVACVSATVAVIASPANDLCVNATSIGAFPYSSGVQSNNCATNDAPAAGSSSCGVHDYNVWYKFTGNGNQINISTCDDLTTFDTELHVFTGSCGSMTEVICSDDGIDAGCSSGRSSLTMCTTNGTTYYISVGSYIMGAGTGNYVLSITNKAIGVATITPNSICGNGAVTLTANVGANADAVDFTINGGFSVTSSDASSPYRYTTAMLTAPQSITVHVRSKNSISGCVGTWTNSAVANAYILPTASIAPLCSFEGMSRVEIIPSGGSGMYDEYQQVSPLVTQSANRFSLPTSATRSFRVKDTHGCYSSAVNYTSNAAPTAIAGASSSGGCIIRNDNSWWHITDPSNNVLLSINDNNNNLGNISAWSYIEPSTTNYSNTYYLKRHFKITSENTPTTNVTLRLYFQDSELSELVTNSKLNSNIADDVNGISDLKITRYSGPNEDNDYSNNDFSCPTCFSVFSPTTGTPSTPNLGSSVKYVEISVPGFSEQWIHGGNSTTSILPVQLISFVPLCNGNDVIVKWVTASELNNRFFTLERSLDGVHYSKIAQVDGAGNSNDFIEYSYVDNFNSSQLIYYRLSQVDNNGTTKVYEPKAIQCQSVDQKIGVQPNPFKDDITITGLNEGVYLIELINSLGQIVYTTSHEGSSTKQLFFESLDPGFYVLKIVNNSHDSQQFKILKNY